VKSKKEKKNQWSYPENDSFGKNGTVKTQM
jgi:hypothetical protein